MITWLRAIMPPPNRPWNTRQQMRNSGLWEKPALAEASTKPTIAIWNSSLRSNRSASLPQIGVAIAVESSMAVTTQV